MSSSSTVADVLAGSARWCVVQGDCAAILPTIARVDMIATDPPYGIDCTKTGSGVPIRGVGHVGPEMARFTRAGGSAIEGDKAPDPSWLPAAVSILRENGALYLFSRWDVDREWQTAIEATGIRIKNRIIWEKAFHGSGDLQGAFGFSHETLWRAVKGRSLLRVPRCGDVWRDAWTECVRHGKTHPFEKPVDLMARCIEADSDPGDVVLDPFAGSGSTGVAAVRLGRRFIGIELDHEYAALARERIAAETAGSTLQAARAGQLALLGGAR